VSCFTTDTSPIFLSTYPISANSFRGNYSRAETIRGNRVQSNLAIRNFLVTLNLFLKAKSSLFLWSKWQIGHMIWFLNTNLFLIKPFLIAKGLTVYSFRMTQNQNYIGLLCSFHYISYMIMHIILSEKYNGIGLKKTKQIWHCLGRPHITNPEFWHKNSSKLPLCIWESNIRFVSIY
jgi:hypothetical protein